MVKVDSSSLNEESVEAVEDLNGGLKLHIYIFVLIIIILIVS